MKRCEEEVRRRGGIERELVSKVDLQLFRRLEHVERMDEYRMARRVMMAEVSGWRVRSTPKLGLMDGVRVVLGCRPVMVEDA